MKLLALDSSAVSASAAIVEDEKILGEFFINTHQTHSQTLVPMVQQVLACTETQISELDALAVSAGPGSFTGIRIGVAAVKGIAMAAEKPCIGVSTLEAMAFNLAHEHAVVCAVMDARCGQVYNALFRADGGKLERLTPDRAISIEALAQECTGLQSALWLVGDGAKLCFQDPAFQGIDVYLPPEQLLYQRASGVAKAAMQKGTKLVTAAELSPVYLRLPQAERELRKRQAGE